MCVIDPITAKSQAHSNRQQVTGKWPASEGGAMYEENLILSRIEELVDQLPYRSVKIEVELPDKTLTLQKDRKRPIGFSVEKSN